MWTCTCARSRLATRQISVSLTLSLSPARALSLHARIHTHVLSLARALSLTHINTHFSPVHCEDNGELQRRLRDMLPSAAAPPTIHVAAAADTEQPSETPVEIVGDEPESQMQATQDSQVDLFKSQLFSRYV